MIAGASQYELGVPFIGFLISLQSHKTEPLVSRNAGKLAEGWELAVVERAGGGIYEQRMIAPCRSP